MKKAKITVASNMTDETYMLLCKKTRERFGDDIEFTRRIDEDILGGFILDLDGMIFDLSLRTRFDELKKHLKR